MGTIIRVIVGLVFLVVAWYLYFGLEESMLWTALIALIVAALAFIGVFFPAKKKKTEETKTTE